MNGHVGRLVEGYEGVHGGLGYGTRNEEGVRILEVADALGLTICNTWFSKAERKLITYLAGEARSTIDYIMVRQRDRRFVRDAKVICVEECVPNHQLVVADITVIRLMKNRTVFIPKLKVWKLSKQPFREQYAAKITDRKEEVKQ